jgi:hypothetical protein
MARPPAEDRPRPYLARLLESVATLMELHEGEQRLELIFRDGYLVKFFTHAGPAGAYELARFDEQAASLAGWGNGQ